MDQFESSQQGKPMELSDSAGEATVNQDSRGDHHGLRHRRKHSHRRRKQFNKRIVQVCLFLGFVLILLAVWYVMATQNDQPRPQSLSNPNGCFSVDRGGGFGPAA